MSETEHLRAGAYDAKVSTTHATDSSGEAPPSRDSRIVVAVALLLGSVILLWILPAFGVIAAFGCGMLLAPWGRHLGERAIISTIVGAGLVALLFVVMTATGATIPPLGWRGLLTVLLLAELALLRRARSAPVFPRLRADDALGLGTAAVMFALLFVPYATVTVDRILNGLLEFWARGEIAHDHSSHLPMFAQTVKAQSWALTGLTSNPFFATYPRLHVAIWSVGEWASGVSPSVPGLELVRPYAAWTALTTALSAAILVWSAALAARGLAGKLTDSRVVRLGAGLAAVVMALWCVLGSLALMSDFSASNYLLGAAAVVGGTTVSVRSRAAMTRVGWFVVPTAALMATYLYTPLAICLIIPGVIVLVTVARYRRNRLWWMLALSLLGGIAALPGIRDVTGANVNGAWGTYTGGLPAFEYRPALVSTVLVLLVLLVQRHRAGNRVTVGLIGPLLATLPMLAFFIVQSLRAGLDAGDSYYANKMVYTLLLASFPLLAAIIGNWVAPRIPAAPPQRRFIALTVTVAVVALLIGEMSVLTQRPGIGGGLLKAPAGYVALQSRITGVTRPPLIGAVTATATLNPSQPGMNTFAYILPRQTIVESPQEYASLFASRTANALATVATVKYEIANGAQEVLMGTADPAATLAVLMRRAPELRETLVVADQATADSLAPLVKEFGPSRIRVIVANQDSPD